MTEQRKIPMPKAEADGISRRTFIVSSAAAGLVMGFVDPLKLTGGIPAALAHMEKAVDPALWYSIDTRGKVVVHVGKAEMGQHVGTPLAQLIAEELGCNWHDISLSYTAEPQYADPGLGALVTGGSWSIFMNFDPMLRAGAAGRMTLIQAGAEMMKVPEGECSAENSKVIHNGSRKSVSFGRIVASGKASKVWTKDELKAIKLKAPSDWTIAGKSTAMLDVPDKSMGKAKYGIDNFLKGMVYGRPRVPPVRYGATVKSVDDSDARKIKGFIKAVVLDDKTKTSTGWIVALATTYEAARAASDALKVEYDLGPNANVSTESIIEEARRLQKEGTTGLYFVKNGDASGAMTKATKKWDAEYITDLAIHCPIEPMNAVAAYDDKTDTWHFYTGNQFATRSGALAAGALGVDPKKVVIHQHVLGGGFGRRLEGDMLIPAGLAAQAVGKPVKLIYAREDDMQMDFTRPLTYQKIAGGVDQSGKIVAMEHDVVCAWPTARWGIPAFLTPSVDKKGALDSFVVNGADYWYDVPNHSVRNFLNKVAQEATPSGQLRSVAPGWTFWAVESFLDEIAHATGRDPVAMRVEMLDGAGENKGGAEKLRTVLGVLTEKVNYGKMQLPKDQGLGIACVSAQERSTATWTACAAHVAVNRATGEVKVIKLTTVMDVGVPVNPDGVRAQIEGSTLWGFSLAMLERATMKNGAIQQKMWDTYTPAREADIPEVEVIMAPSGGHPTGCGEPAVTVVGPAIGNAIFNAVGARVRRLPITAEQVKAAIKA